MVSWCTCVNLRVHFPAGRERERARGREIRLYKTPQPTTFTNLYPSTPRISFQFQQEAGHMHSSQLLFYQRLTFHQLKVRIVLCPTVVETPVSLDQSMQNGQIQRLHIHLVKFHLPVSLSPYKKLQSVERQIGAQFYLPAQAQSTVQWNMNLPIEQDTLDCHRTPHHCCYLGLQWLQVYRGHEHHVTMCYNIQRMIYHEVGKTLLCNISIPLW